MHVGDKPQATRYSLLATAHGIACITWRLVHVCVPGTGQGHCVQPSAEMAGGPGYLDCHLPSNGL
jgi:hypothetical protein